MAKSSYAMGRLWLFYRPGNDILIISAHGGTGGQKFTLPTGKVICRTSVHGFSTTSQVRDVVAFERHNGRRGALWQMSGIGGQQEDWLLGKYARTNGTGPDTYHDYERIARDERIDVASPRNRFFSSEINVSTVLNALPLDRYTKIWFNFCLSKYR